MDDREKIAFFELVVTSLYDIVDVENGVKKELKADTEDAIDRLQVAMIESLGLPKDHRL